MTLPVSGLCTLCCLPARWLTSVLLSAVRFLGKVPGITLWTPAPGLLTAAGVLLLAVGLCAFLRWKNRTRVLFFFSGALLVILSLIPLPHRSTEYIQFSVNDADAALLWDREAAYVIDTGYEDGVLSSFLRRHRLTPTAVILTHLHADHAGGLQSLLEDRIPVPVLYLPDGAVQADVHPDMLLLLDRMRSQGTEIRMLAAGDTFSFPSGEMKVLWPQRGKTRPAQDANESSLVLRITMKGTSLLQTGDLDGRYEMYAAAPSDLLKAAHHGSAGSSSEAFLASVSPQAVLLSCGSLDRHLQFRRRLSEDIALFSTAVGGMLTVRFENNGCTVETFLSPKRSAVESFFFSSDPSPEPR